MKKKRSKSANKIAVLVAKNIVAWIASMFVIIPMLLVIINAFKSSGETISMTMALPKQWDFSNFGTVIEKGKLVQSFFNSLLYAGLGTVLTVFFGAMAAYVFSRRRSKGMGAVYMYVVLGKVIPIN